MSQKAPHRAEDGGSAAGSSRRDLIRGALPAAAAPDDPGGHQAFAFAYGCIKA